MNEATLSIVILAACVISAFLLIGLSIIGFLVPTLGIFGGLGWFMKKRSQQASTMLADAQSWASTTGEITKSRVQVSGGEYTTIGHRIEYQYQVDGTQYSASQVHAGDKFYESYTSDEHYDLVDKYPVGAQVTVFYNPADPSQAALER